MKAHTMMTVGLILAFGPVACATKPPPAPRVQTSEVSTPTGGMRQQAVTVFATVDKIDLDTRRVTLVLPDGSKETIVVSDEARNLDQVKRGDEVAAVYYQSIAFQVLQPGENKETGAAAAEAAARAKLGERPGGVAARTINLVAVIVKLDRAAQIAVLRGSEGNLVTVNVQNPENFDKVKVGDTVEITATEAFAIDVRKASTDR